MERDIHGVFLPLHLLSDSLFLFQIKFEFGQFELLPDNLVIRDALGMKVGEDIPTRLGRMDPFLLLLFYRLHVFPPLLPDGELLAQLGERSALVDHVLPHLPLLVETGLLRLCKLGGAGLPNQLLGKDEGIKSELFWVFIAKFLHDVQVVLKLLHDEMGAQLA